jgi:hypothetical protein
MGAVIYNEREPGAKLRFINKDTGLPSTVIKKTIVDSSETVWISTSGGIARYGQDNELTVFNRDNGFVSNEIYDLFEDSQGRIWISTVEDGLVRMEPGGVYTRFTKENGLLGEMVFSVYEDDKGRFWVSTATGVFLVDADDRIHPLTYKDGLPYLYVYNAFPLGKELWFTSVKGLAQASLEDAAAVALGGSETFVVEVFGIEDGLIASPNALSWPTVDSRDRIWIPTHRGISIFNPENPVYSPQKLPVYIESVSIDEIVYGSDQSIPAVNRGIEKLGFHFTAIAYGKPHAVTYSYYLKGYDTEWSSKSGETTAVY